MIAEFQQIVANRHSYAERWAAETGRGVVGYLCSYAPEELLYAAGLLPVRILSSHQPQDVTEKHIPTMYCPFSRSLLAEGLLGRYSYLQGLVLAKSCIHVHQVFDSWTRLVPLSYWYFIDVPRSPQAGGIDYYVQELARFQESVETWTGRKTTPETLRQAIAIYQTNRELLRRLYEGRKADTLSGSEAMTIVMSSMVIDKAAHNQLLSRFLAEPAPKARSDGARLLVVGSANDEIEVIQLIESLGARVVADDQCFGSRYFWESELAAAPEGDPLELLARYYLGRPPCPTKDFGGHRRLRHILSLAHDYQVEGVVFLHQKFCHPHEYDYPYLERSLRGQGLPSCVLELDTTIPLGQLRTRVEAFLEMLV